MKLWKGMRVCYDPDYDNKENGVIKSIHEDGKHAYVVYNCGGNWHKYEKYTGAKTKISDLKKGWDDNAPIRVSNEYLKHNEDLDEV